MKKIVFYYHHFGGYGHGMRIYSICKALQAIEKHNILVINSGIKQPELGINRFAHVLNLPPITAANSLFQGLKSEGNIKTTLAKRKAILEKIVIKFNPDLAVIEHFPFGRMSLKYEIIAFIDELKKNKCKIYSSVRDLILSKGKKQYFSLFNGIFIHEDPALGFCSDAPQNSVFTGRVHPYDTFTPQKKDKLRESLDLDSKKLIVVSIGGGIDGHELIKKFITIKTRIDKKFPCFLLIFTGKTFPGHKYGLSDNILPHDCKMINFDSHLIEYIQSADLFVSMGGYNSINSHLLTDTPSMIFPRLSDKEQSVRTESFGFKCYDYINISEDDLLSETCSKLSVVSEEKKLSQMNGAKLTAQFIVRALNFKVAKIRLTTTCNLNCPMCSWKYRDQELKEAKVYEILDELAMIYIEEVNFTGGEPTSYPCLEKIIKYAKSKGFKTSLSTNGYDQKSLMQLVRYLDFADISLDSHIEQLNDKIRGKKGAYCATVKSIFYLSENGIKPHINVTVRPDNYKGLHKIIQLFQNQISSISFTIVDATVNQMKELEFSYEQLKEYYFDEVVKILKYSIKYSIKLRITPFYDHFTKLNSLDKLAELLNHKEELLGRFNEIFTLTGKECLMSKANLRINSNGEVSPCCYLDDNQCSLGNINDKPLKEIVMGNKYFNHTFQA